MGSELAGLQLVNGHPSTQLESNDSCFSQLGNVFYVRHLATRLLNLDLPDASMG
jgi:hypothetical protein